MDRAGYYECVQKAFCKEIVMAAQAEVICSVEEAMHCEAFNAAFYELGLKWYWNLPTYSKLQPNTPNKKEQKHNKKKKEQAHLLKAYQPEFLVDAILDTKARCLSNRLACGSTGLLGVSWVLLFVL